MDSSSTLTRRPRGSTQSQNNHPITETPANIVYESPANDPHSLWRFRFWRCLTMAFHAIFLHCLLQREYLAKIPGINPTISVIVLSILLSAIALYVYYWIARLVCSLDRRDNLMLTCQVIAVLIHELILQISKEDTHFHLIFALQGLSFIAYLRSVAGGDRSETISVLSLAYARTAVRFYLRSKVINSAYFAAVPLVGYLALVIGKGYRPTTAGAFDRFLDILGDLDP